MTEDAEGGDPARSMLIRELCRLTREARDLDLGSRCPVKHIRDVRGDSGSLAAFAQEHVGGSKPLLLEGALDGWPAWGGGGDDDGEDSDARRWTPDSLLRREGDTLVTLTVTPDGRADAVRPIVLDASSEGEDRGRQQPLEHFVLPHEERVPLRDFLLADGRLAPPAAEGPDPYPHAAAAPARYLSSQNGCLEAELPGLLPDLLDPEEEEEEGDDGNANADANADEQRRRRQAAAAGGPRWAREALSGGRPAEAVNVWIGCSRSETSVHRDPYENVFAVLRGAKTFTLLPPHEGFRLGLEVFPVCRWSSRHPGGGQLVALPAAPRREVLWTALDPSRAEQEQQRARYPLFFVDQRGGTRGGGPATGRLPPPIRVTVRAGQLLYLPAFWWHHVAQRGPPGQERDGCCIGVNWWFEPRFGSSYALTRFAERLAARAGLLRPMEGDGEDDDDREEEAEGDEDDDNKPDSQS